MDKVTIKNLINSAIQQLNAFHLCDGTMDSYQSRAFKPVSDYYCQKEELYYQPELTDELKMIYHEQFNLGIISRNALCWRMRGIEILEEMRQHGCFEWKVFTVKKNSYCPAIMKRFFPGSLMLSVLSKESVYTGLLPNGIFYIFSLIAMIP